MIFIKYIGRTKFFNVLTINEQNKKINVFYSFIGVSFL